PALPDRRLRQPAPRWGRHPRLDRGRPGPRRPGRRRVAHLRADALPAHRGLADHAGGLGRLQAASRGLLRPLPRPRRPGPRAGRLLPPVATMASPTVPAPVLARPVPVPAPHRVPAAGRWAGAGAACLTLGSLALHVVMLASGGHGLVLGLLLAVMALACTGCAAHAVLRPGCRGSLALAGMSIGMALVHA